MVLSFILMYTAKTLLYFQYFNHAIELEPDKGHSKYMYLAQLLTGQNAIQCFSKGVNIMKQELERGSTHRVAEENEVR